MKLMLQPDRRQLRQFAWVSLFFFPGLGAFLAWKYGLPMEWVYALVGLGLVVALVELVLAEALGSVGTLLEKLIPRAFFQLLTLLAFPIGFVLSHVLMALIYYLVMTPIGLIFRLIGRDAMGRKPDPKLVTYWHDRGAPRSPASYFKLY
jgi:hypothetical protein